MRNFCSPAEGAIQACHAKNMYCLCRCSAHATGSTRACDQNPTTPSKPQLETSSTSDLVSTSDPTTPSSRFRKCAEATQPSSRRKALKYAEQVGWLTSHAEELQAALDFQMSRAASLSRELEQARTQLAARIAEDERSAVVLAEEHAAALATLEGEVETERSEQTRLTSHVADLESRYVVTSCGTLALRVASHVIPLESWCSVYLACMLPGMFLSVL
jgi:hypothetical protein